jgi:hypothetical protein
MTVSRLWRRSTSPRALPPLVDEEGALICPLCGSQADRVSPPRDTWGPNDEEVFRFTVRCEACHFRWALHVVMLDSTIYLWATERTESDPALHMFGEDEA